MAFGNQWTNNFFCKCTNKEDCPMGGMCNSEKVVYKATIFSIENSKAERVYIEISAGNWKQVLQSHFFSNPLLRNQTALSRWFWSLRDRGLTPQIKCRFIKKISILANYSINGMNLYVNAPIKIDLNSYEKG